MGKSALKTSASELERCESLTDCLRADTQRASGHGHNTDRAVAGRADLPDGPVQPVGVGPIPHHVAFGHPVLQERNVLDTGRVAQHRRPVSPAYITGGRYWD
jgi:hypothetical protein